MRKGIKLSTAVGSRSNNFDFLRFLAASLVIFSHSYALKGVEGQEPFARASNFLTFGGLGVCIFFVISGFLITKSWTDNPHLIRYFKKRLLRILPALGVSVLLCVFVIGPFVTSLSMTEYFSHKMTYKYLRNILLYPLRYDLPGVFADNPYPYAVNGSLWTLAVEFTLYCCVALCGFAGFLKRGVASLAIILLLLRLAMFLKPEFQEHKILCMNAGQLAQFSPFFFLGAVCFLFREKLVLWGSVCAVLIVLFVVSFKTPYVHLMGYVALPCLVLYLAFTDIPFLRNFGKYGDASYGMYVYAFPVQQTLIHYLGNQISVAAFFACSFFVTLLVSFLSWHIVEHPALGLKNVRLLPWRRVETDVVPEERVTQE